MADTNMKHELRYEVRYTDAADAEQRRLIYGRASDRSGADALVASLKVQNVRPVNVVTIDLDRTVACRSCGAAIIWLKTSNGKNCPCDAATVADEDEVFDHRKHISHFATCPNADQHRRPR